MTFSITIGPWMRRLITFRCLASPLFQLADKKVLASTLEVDVDSRSQQVEVPPQNQKSRVTYD